MRDPHHPPPLNELLDALESLHREIVDLEAMAHAAAEVLQHMPYLPRLPHSGLARDRAHLADIRRQFGRLYALVAATADTAASALERAGELTEALHALRARLDSAGPGGDNGGSDRASDHAPGYPGLDPASMRGTRTGDSRARARTWAGLAAAW